MAFESYSAQDFLRRKETKEITKKVDRKTESVKIMEHLLSLFGTEQAKQKFLKLCKEFRTAFWRQRDEEITERVLKRTGKEESSKSEIHNKIMDIVSKLSSLPDADMGFFSKIGNKDQVAQMILDYLNFYEEEEAKKAA